jgi:hypothetical protein
MSFGVRLLLIVALLLPFRGGMAAAGVLCHAGGNAKPAVAAGAEHHQHAHAAHHAHDDGAAAAHAAHDEPGAPADAQTDQPDSSCPFCTAVCGAPPLPVTAVSTHALPPAGGERFPALSPPRSTLVFGAPDRPPRVA